MTGSDSSIFIDPKDQELKKQLVLEELTKFIFTADNDILSKNHDHVKLVKKELLREVATSYSGSQTSHVTIDVISGGLTNYSFKINFSSSTCPPLYAKLSFETAFWNPNKDEKFDLQRTKNEYDIMKLFATEMDSMVATPYACLDLYTPEDGPMKLLITEWCRNDQQMAHQFTFGHIDSRLGPKLAHALASLHSIENFAPNANSQCREYFSKAFELIRHTFDCDLKKSSGRTAKLCQLLDDSDDKTLDTIYHNCLQILGQRECLVHNDFHFFNVIVEKCINEASSSSFEFGPDGSVTIVDWEMCMAGVAGADVGHGLGFVLACAVAHALNGRMDLCQNVLKFCFQFWESYANEIRLRYKQKNVEQVLQKRFRDCLGGIGIMAYCGHYFMGAHMEFLPPSTKTDEEESSQQRNNEYVRDAIGVIGLKVLQIAYGITEETSSSSLEEMLNQYKALVQEETECAYKMFQQKKQSAKKEKEDTHEKHATTGRDTTLLKPRSKSYFLHRTTVPTTTMNRRVSDTSGLNLVKVLLHTSPTPVVAFENFHRTSVF